MSNFMSDSLTVDDIYPVGSVHLKKNRVNAAKAG